MLSTNEIIFALNIKTQKLDHMYASIAEARTSGAPIIVTSEEKVLEVDSLLSLICKAYIVAGVSYNTACAMLKAQFDNKYLIAEGDGLVEAAAKAQAVVIAGEIQLAPIQYMGEIYRRVNVVIEPAENAAMRTKASLEALENSVAESPQIKPR